MVAYQECHNVVMATIALADTTQWSFSAQQLAATTAAGTDSGANAE
jgi:hypothetical protein